MPAGATFAVFVVAALALLLLPGPNVLYLVARGIDQGRRPALISTLSIGLGDLVHVTAAAIGLSALLRSSAVAFSAVKFLGAGYLVFLGIRTLLDRSRPAGADARIVSPAGREFLQGLTIAVFNPKTAIFFLAFFPQFVDPDRGAAWSQILMLGAVFVLLGITTNSCYAMLASTAGNFLKSSVGFRRSQRYVAGTVYIALGISTALVGSKQAKL
jgi:threonine/homoserine/homoserine lactone efflux protein